MAQTPKLNYLNPIDIENICRICMSKNELRSLFTYSKKNRENLTFSDMFSECVSLHITETDNLPHKICQKCAYLLSRFYKFKKLAKISDKKFRDCMKFTQTEIDENAKTKIEDNGINENSSNYNSCDMSIKQGDNRDEVENDKNIENNITSTNLGFKDNMVTKDQLKLEKIILPTLKQSNKTRIINRNFKRKLHLVESDSRPIVSTYQCDTCGKCLSYRTNLVMHMRKHTGERPFPCDLCGKCFTRAEHVDVHKRIHTGERPYKCDICNKSFVQNGTLICHLRTHTGERPHICTVCGKAFSQAITLTYHMRTHTGETPFKCKICGKGFTHSGNLNIHMRFHSGERPYECTICRQRFVTSSHLSIHNKYHRGEKNHICNVCGKAFLRKEHLRDHILIHTGDRPHECKLCPKKYTQSSHLRRHMKSHTIKVQNKISLKEKVNQEET